MLLKKKIAVVVPAYNEEKMIGKVIQTMPNFVDLIIIVDDVSQDKTVRVALDASRKSKKKVEIIRHQINRGVGAAIVTGYRRALELKIETVAVMAGDAQMDPKELKGLVMP